ncbi:MAG: MCE family protein [Deltaproteobacteria bacterium]|nr:MCE family protein [Deltaproteobacteria bacterium]
MKPTLALQMKVGLLILISLIIFGSTIFLMGKERRLFETKVPFEVRFARTIGLREGAPISLAGVTVGSVESLTFAQDIRENYIVVRIKVVGDVAPRIRKDTVARIRTLGLLGDKYIELSGGSPRSDPVPPSGLISSIDPIDYEALLGEGGGVVENFIEVTSSLKTILQSIGEGKGLIGQIVAPGQEEKWAEMANNLRAISVSLRSASESFRNILGVVEKGEGILGQLFQNKEAGQVMMEDLKISLNRLSKATESLQKTTEKVEKGEGTLGTLIHDPQSGKEILANLRRSASNLESVTRQLREGEGIFQRLITDSSYADRLLGHLEQTSRDLSHITGKIERGEGTIGALVNDPELYKDAKELVGTAKGSWLFSISRFFRNLFSSGEDSPTGRTSGETKKAD